MPTREDRERLVARYGEQRVNNIDNCSTITVCTAFIITLVYVILNPGPTVVHKFSIHNSTCIELPPDTSADIQIFIMRPPEADPFLILIIGLLWTILLYKLFKCYKNNTKNNTNNNSTSQSVTPIIAQ